MSRCVVNVATGHYKVGQGRLLTLLGGDEQSVMWADQMPDGCPSHQEKPYAFKAYALLQAATRDGATQLMWCDACIVPVKPLDSIWEYAQEHGVWIGKNYGFTNYEWCADSAYDALFPGAERSAARLANKQIPHVIATAFALDLDHEKGHAFLTEYYRLASETDAFCGPWINHNRDDATPCPGAPRCVPCGPTDVRGHRHDQSCASVIAWRLAIPLTHPPLFFAYRGGETDETILVADGSY